MNNFEASLEVSNVSDPRVGELNHFKIKIGGSSYVPIGI